MNVLDPLLRLLRPEHLCRWGGGCETVTDPDRLLCDKHEQQEREQTTATTKETQQ